MAWVNGRRPLSTGSSRPPASGAPAPPPHATHGSLVFQAKWPSRSTAGGREPPSQASARCEVRINGTCVTRLPLTNEWSTFRFSAPCDLVRSGVNWLEIDWPLDLPSGEEEIEHA